MDPGIAIGLLGTFSAAGAFAGGYFLGMVRTQERVRCAVMATIRERGPAGTEPLTGEPFYAMTDGERSALLATV